MPKIVLFILAHWSEIYGLANLIIEVVKKEPTKELQIKKKNDLFCALKGTCQ